MTKDLNIILQGITGSTAYGLATPTSDIDRQGIYLAPNTSLLGIFPPQGSIVRNNPDITYHELGKYAHLAAKANPTVLEQLFLDTYETVHPAAQLLIDNRDAFLSKAIYKSYGGYAYAQAKRLNARGDSFSSETKKRTAKHARHCMRLIQQGSQLLQTGTMSIRVVNRDELFAFGELPMDKIVDRFFEEFKKFDAIQTSLPEKPDLERINRLVLEIRGAYGETCHVPVRQQRVGHVGWQGCKPGCTCRGRGLYRFRQEADRAMAPGQALHQAGDGSSG